MQYVTSSSLQNSKSSFRSTARQLGISIGITTLVLFCFMMTILLTRLHMRQMCRT